MKCAFCGSKENVHEFVEITKGLVKVIICEECWNELDIDDEGDW